MITYILFVAACFFCSMISGIIALFVYRRIRRKKRSQHFNADNFETSNMIASLERKVSHLERELQTLKDDVSKISKDMSHSDGDRKQSRLVVDKTSTQSAPKKNKNSQKKEKNKSPKVIERPTNESGYKFLTIQNKHLCEVGSGQPYYYRAWECNGKIYFEFFTNENIKLVINNRIAYITQWCEKSLDSIEPEQANQIEVEDPGTLNKDYSIINKTTIKYI